ncbi:hypothetical protein N9N67_09905 [Bacteriovoracaceae bacterium]|nr:hypothetical protein [Bacteriovoracaceae bacterium]
MKKIKLGVIQICSYENAIENQKKIELYLKEALKEGIKYIFLPEVFYSLSKNARKSENLVTDPQVQLQFYCELAKKYDVYLIGGTVAVKEGDKVLNQVIHFYPDGSLKPIYNKNHLFSCIINKGLENEQIIDENQSYDPGNLLASDSLPDFKLGLSVCFDLRYSHVYKYYREQNCEIVSISSAFTKITGAAHWHTLVRARAIENQYFIVATNQWGIHNDKMETYGHSLIVNPWGEVLLDLGEGEKFGFCEIDLSEIEKFRDAIQM